MTYYFDEIIDRRNTNSLKWDVEEKELPMWVADMDFQTAPEIREAIEKQDARRAEAAAAKATQADAVEAAAVEHGQTAED